jgi:serine/threonine-protein kinase
MDELLDRVRAAVADHYGVVGELGRGGMATIFLADDHKHHRRVAIKVLRPDLADVLGTERFLQEIRIAARLNHPHIVPVHDSGEAAGLLYYVMPVLEGETLRTRMNREGPLPLADALAIVRQVAGALDHAHAQGIVHRDLKPENILLTRGEAVLADFGIAFAVRAAGGRRLTASGISLGTPEYMSPEQTDPEATVDGRSDVYALGVVLYEMLTGEPPITGPTPVAVVAKLLHQTPTPPRVVRRDLPPPVNRAIMAALAKVPADRPATAGALVDALDAARAAPRALPRWAWAAAALLVAGLTVAGWRLLPPRAFALAQRDWVLVADFSGPPDDPGLGVAVRNLVLADLNQSRFVSTVPDELVRNAMRDAGVAETTRVDTRLGAELAFRTSVRVLLAGSVDRLGNDTYAVVIHVLDAEDGGNILSASGTSTGGEAALVRTVQDVVRDIRLGLGERRDVVEANRPLMRVRTPDLTALRRFADGIEALRGGNPGMSTLLLREAVARDTAFAAAWAALASTYLVARQVDSARAAFARAAAHRERMGDADWYRLQGDMAYAVEQDLGAALRWYDLYLQERPNSVPGRNNRALYLSALGRHAEARHELEQAAVIDPLHKGPRQIQLLNLLAELVVTGALDSARALAPRLDGAFGTYAELLLLNATADWAGAERRATQVLAAPSTPAFLLVPAVTTQAGAAAALGRDADARALLTGAMAANPGAPARWYARARLLLELATDAAISPLPAALRSDTSDGGVLLAGLRAAAAGDTVTARRQLRRLEQLDLPARRRLGHGPATLQALIDRAAGRWQAVVDGLGQPARDGEHDPFSLDRVDSFLLRWLVATAYGEQGRHDSAAAVMERVVAPTGFPPGHYGLRGITYRPGTARLAQWQP